MWDAIRIILVIVNVVALILFLKSIFFDRAKPIKIDRIQPWEIQRLIEEEIEGRIKK